MEILVLILLLVNGLLSMYFSVKSFFVNNYAEESSLVAKANFHLLLILLISVA